MQKLVRNTTNCVFAQRPGNRRRDFTAILFSANVTNNTANGVQLIQGSGVVFRPVAPLSVISNNTGFDLKCFDTESSITTGYAGSPTMDGCTGF